MTTWKGNGYILHWRKVEDNPIFQGEKFDRYHAWFWILEHAAFRDHFVYLDGKKKLNKRGDYITSISKLAEIWRWNRRTVSGFLKLLESEGMIHRSVHSRGIVITVENYSDYQIKIPPSTQMSAQQNTKVHRSLHTSMHRSVHSQTDAEPIENPIDYGDETYEDAQKSAQKSAHNRINIINYGRDPAPSDDGVPVTPDNKNGVSWAELNRPGDARYMDIEMGEPDVL